MEKKKKMKKCEGKRNALFTLRDLVKVFFREGFVLLNLNIFLFQRGDHCMYKNFK